MDLFEVEADDAEYWRMFTLDAYDGESWTSTNPGGSKGGVTLSAPATLPGSGGGSPSVTETLIQTFRILSTFESAHSLPMAQTAEEIAGPVGDITWDPARSQAFIDGRLEAGMEYTVHSRIVVPTAEELDRVDHLAPRTYGQWTELPELDPRIGEIAKRWTADATSSYRKVLAIQERFHNRDFDYSTDVEAADDVDSLLAFLTRTRVGFCQHYTAAMTVMVRALGLPARIAVGFRSGTKQEDGGFLVRTGDAHVWVEVLFPGYGWLQFEPEPGPAPHPNATAGTYLDPVETKGSIVTSTRAGLRRRSMHRRVLSLTEPGVHACPTAERPGRRATRKFQTAVQAGNRDPADIESAPRLLAFAGVGAGTPHP